MKIVNFHPATAPFGFTVHTSVHASFDYSTHLIFGRGLDDVHTYQMALLNRAWDEGMAIRIWYNDEEEGYTYQEVKNGDYTPGGLQLRTGHNLQRIWQACGLGGHLVTGFKQERGYPESL